MWMLNQLSQLSGGLARDSVPLGSSRSRGCMGWAQLGAWACSREASISAGRVWHVSDASSASC